MVVYNVQQEKVQIGIPFDRLNTLQSFKVGVMLLRRQLAWGFVFSWAALLLSFIPSFDQGGVMNRKIFLDNWAALLPFSNVWVDSFLIASIIIMFTGVFMYEVLVSLSLFHFLGPLSLR